MQPLPTPTVSPYRRELDRLAAPIVAGLLAGTSPLARSLVGMATLRQGWDWTRPVSTGPLAAVSDAALRRLAHELVDALIGIEELDGADAWDVAPLPRALEELRAARR